MLLLVRLSLLFGLPLLLLLPALFLLGLPLLRLALLLLGLTLLFFTLLFSLALLLFGLLLFLVAPLLIGALQFVLTPPLFVGLLLFVLPLSLLLGLLLALASLFLLALLIAIHRRLRRFIPNDGMRLQLMLVLPIVPGSPRVVRVSGRIVLVVPRLGRSAPGPPRAAIAGRGIWIAGRLRAPKYALPVSRIARYRARRSRSRLA